jgi:hypothetical protein
MADVAPLGTRATPPFPLFVSFVCFVVNNPPSVLIREIRGFRFLKFGCGSAALGSFVIQPECFGLVWISGWLIYAPKG